MTIDTPSHDLEPFTLPQQKTPKKTVIPKQPLIPDTQPFWSVSPVTGL